MNKALLNTLVNIYPGRNFVLYSIIKILLILLAGSFFVYGIGQVWANTLYFSLVFLLFLSSRNALFWVTLLFIMMHSPLGLFYHRWNEWIIALTPTVGISFKTLIGIVLMVKWLVFIKGKRIAIHDFMKRKLLIAAFYAFFLVLWGLVYGFSVPQLFSLTSFWPSFLFFFVMPTFFNKQELNTFNKIVFVFVILHNLLGFFDIITSGSIIKLLVFGKDTATASIFDEGLVRITGGIFLSLHAMIFGMYYLAGRERVFKNWYLWLVILISWLFILSSATRGWMIASFFLMLFFLLFYARSSVLSPKTIIPIAFLLVIGYFAIPAGVKKNLGSAFDRLSTVESVAEGDFTAGETASRWDVRGPRALTRFDESPLFGFGYSRVTHEYYDGHVGNHTLLLVGGIVGFAIIWLTVLGIMLFLFKQDFIHGVKGLFVFGLGLGAIMIIHSTSRNMVSFLMPPDTAFFLGIVFNFINVVLTEAKLKAHNRMLNKSQA